MKNKHMRMGLKKAGGMILAAMIILTAGSMNVYAETDSETAVETEAAVEDDSVDDQEAVTNQQVVDIQQAENEIETDIQGIPVSQEAVNTQIDNDIQDINDEEVSDPSGITGDETIVKGSAVVEAVEKKNGVIKEDGVYRYYIDDVMQKWLITDANGDRYYADANGVLACNKIIKFINTSIGWLYFGDDGKAKKWLITTLNGDRYYAGSDSALVRNRVIKFNDKKIGWLYFGDDGRAKKWLITASNGDRYYAGSDGALVRNRVIKFNDKSIGWLYFGDDGKAKKWLITASNGDRYYAGSDGALVRNKLIKFNNESLGWLYFGNDAKVAKAQIIVAGGNYYYATSVDGRIMRTKGWIILNGNKYYAGDGGALLRSVWKKIGATWYHFGSNGVNDNSFAIDPNDSPAQQKANKVLNSIGPDLKAAFNYSAGLTYKNRSLRAPASVSSHVEYFANYGFTNKYGNCYVMAATFCAMARELGYECYLVEGWVPKRGGGVTEHSWTEIIINGTKYVCDPNFTNETGKNGYMINYGNSGTWRYQSYKRVN